MRLRVGVDQRAGGELVGVAADRVRRHREAIREANHAAAAALFRAADDDLAVAEGKKRS